MTAEENIARYVRYLKFTDSNAKDGLDDLVSPNAVRYYSGHGEVADRGFDEFVGRVTTHAHEIYADIQTTIKDIAVNGDVVFARLALEGTHVGQSKGRPAPDNKRWGVQYCSITRWLEGRIIEERWFWGNWAHV